MTTGDSRRIVTRGERPRGPRRVNHGIKLRARDGLPAGSGLAGAMVRLIDAIVMPQELPDGLDYARRGQIVSLDVDDGAAVRVQGTGGRPYRTTIEIGAFGADRWEALVEAMADEAVYMVKLRAGELPDTLNMLLAAHGLVLLPDSPSEVKTTCSCPRPAGCRHIVALGYVLAERLSEEPLTALRFRGMPGEQLIERLRQTRMIRARGTATAHVDPPIGEDEQAPPLEECVAGFWRPGPAAAADDRAVPPKHVAHALLRRLGPSPLDGTFPFSGLLASIYDRVKEHADEILERAETGNGNGNGSSRDDDDDEGDEGDTDV